ncbi:MAG: enoyl-CoA hydratase-related protein [Desulfosalsimonadaceae bacterium]|nr:MAG: enoyl-CoA hydratase [Desulfobacteraceae bacterium]
MVNEMLVKEKNGSVGTIIFNRPERKNSLSPELLLKLHLILKEWAQDETIRAVVFTGSGDKAFSSGYDILAIPTDLTPEMAELMKKENPLKLAMSSVKHYPFPTIAMMNGYALGAGLNLALCCDIRVAVEDISVSMPPAKLGLIYHPEGIKQFVEVIGLARTKEIFFTARKYKGREVKEMGIVDYLVPRAELSATTYALANEIAANAPLSLKGTKRILGMLSRAVEFKESDLKEADAILAEGFNSEDLKEGQTAFIEKRKPVFKGC